MIFENWTGGTGYEGKSLNFVDPVSGRWRQTWVDNKGGSIEFTGGMEEGVMTFYAEARDKEGKPFRRRLRFFDLGPDSVRQFSERTYDAAHTWHVEYDFTYLRRKPE